MTGDRDWTHDAERAADRALEAGNEHAAVMMLHEALTAVAHPADRRVALARKLGEAAAWGATGLGDLGRQVVDAVRTVLNSDVPAAGRGEVRLLLGRLLFQLGEFDEATAEIEAAVADLNTRPDLAARAMTLLAFPRGQDWPVERHRGWLDRAQEPASRVRSAEDRLSVTVDRASALLMLGDAEGWVAAEAIDASVTDLERPVPERRQVARGLMNVGHLGIAWGRYGESRRRLDQAIELMRSTGYERLLNSAELTRAHLDWQEGAWAGLSDRVAALAAAEFTLPEARMEAHLLLGLSALAAGHPALARERLEAVLDEAARHGLVDAQAAPAAALGRLLVVEGDADAALVITGPVVDLIAAKGMWVWASDVLVSHVDALVRTGRVDAAAAWAARFTAGLGTNPAPSAQVAARVCTAIATCSTERAADLLAATARGWAALPRPFHELQAVERRDLLLLDVGEENRALESLTAVEQRLRSMGAPWDADRVARVLRRHGVDVARAWRGGRRGYGNELSPRELEVLRLVAGGQTNRQVAAGLFLSTRTVDRHLSAAMRKLGVTSRTALAVAAHQAGLLTGEPGTAPDLRSSFG